MDAMDESFDVNEVMLGSVSAEILPIISFSVPASIVASFSNSVSIALSGGSIEASSAVLLICTAENKVLFLVLL